MLVPHKDGVCFRSNYEDKPLEKTSQEEFRHSGSEGKKKDETIR